MRALQIYLKRLRCVVIIARAASYTAATSELGLTQSAVTRSVPGITPWTERVPKPRQVPVSRKRLAYCYNRTASFGVTA